MNERRCVPRWRSVSRQQLASQLCDERYLTPDEMAGMLRTTRKAIYAQTARGQLSGVTKIGRRLLFLRRDVLDANAE